MSADNGYVVSRLAQPQDEYGIFYYSGDGSSSYTRDDAEKTFTNPVHAILEAHILQNESRTEYGVYVRNHVLADCKDHFQFNTNEIVKAGRQAGRR